MHFIFDVAKYLYCTVFLSWVAAQRWHYDSHTRDAALAQRLTCGGSVLF